LAVGRGATPGAELGELRSLDVAPTVLRLLGLQVPDTMQGRPIARLLPETAAASASAGASGSPPTSGSPSNGKQP
jgi:arylsulfatase A-like enzyme